jgi:dolichol-phosphate mannosyltransferase
MENRNFVAEGSIAIVFPSYLETENLKLIVKALSAYKSRLIIVISDDSGPGVRDFLEKEILSSKGANCSVFFSYSDAKSGRGEAVRRGVLWVLDNFPMVESIIEADSDGSHSSIAILELIDRRSREFDVLVGSRYLRQSRIVGWSKGRKVQSRILNLVIPLLLKLPLKDVTNGLRLYNRESAFTAYGDPLLSQGFTHLTEVALRLKYSGAKFLEVPIVFEERVHGQSSVGARELKDSFLGLIRIFMMAFWRK